jgi:MHS family proline/betaine transporter-like MFS transporter
LQLILGLMTAAIAMMAFAPTYAAIGLAAPLIIVLARLLQGFATGGEFGSATAFLIESAPANRRGFYGSGLMVGAGLAMLTGALISSFVTRNLAPDALDSWGWRVPFLFGLIIGPVGLYIRSHLEETEAFLEARAAAKEKDGFGRMVAMHVREMVVCLGLFSNNSMSFYVILLYMPTFANTQLHLPLTEALVAQSIGLACFSLLVPLFGALSDRIGRKPIFITTLVLYLSVAYPLFFWVHANPSFANLAYHADCAIRLARGLFGSPPDSSRRAVSGSDTLDRYWHCRQPIGYGIGRLRAVLRDMVNRGDRFANRPGVLRDVRRRN